MKIVEKIKISSREERFQKIRDAKFNLFNLKSENVMIDLLTDSGTGAMSTNQCAAMMIGDETYAGSSSFYKFEQTVKDITNFKFIFPVHQGRAAERILFNFLCAPGKIVLSNGLFDTTRGNIEHLQCKGIDIPLEESEENYEIFKGNISLEKLERHLKIESENVAFVILTVTSNISGGQPVSISNIEATRKLCNEYNVLLIIDGCRFAENAYFIKERECEVSHLTIKEISQKMFSFADGMTMSAKKDGMVHIGGWIGFNNTDLSDKIRNLMILTEGFPTYGGLAGRDLEAIAQGLEEVLDEDYLKYRIESSRYLGEKLIEVGIPIIEPIGGHAVFIDAKTFLPHISPLEYPAQALAVELYIAGGIRSVGIDSLMFGLQPDGSEKPARHELVRLALPRRVYSKSHLDYIVEVMSQIKNKCKRLKGFEIVKSSDCLRHFTCELKYLITDDKNSDDDKIL